MQLKFKSDIYFILLLIIILGILFLCQNRIIPEKKLQ